MLQRISPLFFELFSKIDKNCDFFIFERFLGYSRGQNMENELLEESPFLFNLQTTWNQLS